LAYATVAILFTLKMATAMCAETEHLQHVAWLELENQSNAMLESMFVICLHTKFHHA
jgi:hypothetical protein